MNGRSANQKKASGRGPIILGCTAWIVVTMAWFVLVPKFDQPLFGSLTFVGGGVIFSSLVFFVVLGVNLLIQHYTTPVVDRDPELRKLFGDDGDGDGGAIGIVGSKAPVGVSAGLTDADD